MSNRSSTHTPATLARSARFQSVANTLVSPQIWEYQHSESLTIRDVADEVRRVLRTPADFPPITAALTPDDRVALAVDPNVPMLEQVIEGVIAEVTQVAQGQIDIVLWDEATEAIMRDLSERFQNIAVVTRHDSEHRESLRYLGADLEGDPIYLNAKLADADLVLPILAGRPWDADGNNELSGVYPTFADSNTRWRHQAALGHQSKKKRSTNEAEVGWMLGVQLILVVGANRHSSVSHVYAGMTEAIEKQFSRPRRADDEFPPAAPLVIATLEGNAQQQTWENVARAIAAAETYTIPDGTILLWTELDTPPSSLVARMLTENDLGTEVGSCDEFQLNKNEDGFSRWDASVSVAQTISRVRQNHRIVLASKLSFETVEQMQIGWIQSADSLEKLSAQFEAAGILRSASFAGGTYDILRSSHAG